MVQQNAGIVEKEIGSEEASFIGWSSFLNYLSKDSVSLSDKGTLFEKVCKKLLLTAPFFNGEVKEVWRWADWPGNGGLHDIGIDLVVLETSGTYMAVQSKFYDANASISKADIDSFLSAGARSYTDPKTGESIVFSTLLIMSTTGNVSANAKAVCVDHHPYVVFFGPEELRTCGIDWLHFDIQDIEGMKASEKKTLRKHQSKALEQVLAGFANHDRGKMIMACGTGKTFTSLKIVENYIEKKHLNNPTILYLVPSIALLSQTVLEWKSQFGLKQGNDMLAVCSDATAANVSRKSEVEDGDLTNIPIPATTSVSFVKKAYDKIQNDGKVHFFFSTYQSIDVIHKVQEECHIVFDMVVCDEAHRTIGAYLSSDDNAEDRSDFTKIHDNKYIPAKKRLYMTATEKIFGTGAKNKASNAGYEVYSMDDESVFGPTFYSLSFGQAVEQDLLSDYRLVVLQVKESQVTSLFLPGEGGTIDENARIVGSLAALSKRV